MKFWKWRIWRILKEASGNTFLRAVIFDFVKAKGNAQIVIRKILDLFSNPTRGGVAEILLYILFMYGKDVVQDWDENTNTMIIKFKWKI